MVNKKTEKESEDLRAWFKPKLNEVVQEMIKRNAVTGAAVEASPAWALPGKILIAKVWGMGEKSRFVWTISGEEVITDHINGSMATTPKDAARHFALKWQMDADRLLAVGSSQGSTADTQSHMGDYAKKLIKDAESLYDLTERDEMWQ